MIHLGDCLDIMPNIGNESCDLILADLPYGTTYGKWDSIIPMNKLWEQYRRIAKPHAAIVLFAAQPFTSLLIVSNLAMFRCEWIWDKKNGANFANTSHQPLKQHESIIVFGREKPRYFPQKIAGQINHKQGKSQTRNCETQIINTRSDDDLSGMKFPKSILYFPKHSSNSRNHPTEKPIDLLRYLIRTYSKENDLVMDNTMGSGSTGVAAVLENRNFIGIEKEPRFFEIAEKRIEEAKNEFFR
jgi:site-specific DNA-methyltransferase (adenine-specific)